MMAGSRERPAMASVACVKWGSCLLGVEVPGQELQGRTRGGGETAPQDNKAPHQLAMTGRPSCT